MTDGFQQAAAEQTDALERVHRAAAAHMNEQGVFQWRATFPTRDHIVRDIAAGDLFVLVRGGELAGALAFGRGCRSLRLMVLETNRFALGLYAKTGFAARGQFPFEDYGTFLFMEKDIPFGGGLYPAGLQSKLGSKP